MVKTKETTMIGIATPPDGEVVMTPGIEVGNGLAVAEIPPDDGDTEQVYSVTHIGSGRRVGINFFSQPLALRCAREMARVQNFDETPDVSDTEAMEKFGRRTRVTCKPIMEAYQKLDDLWIDRQRWEQGAE